MSMNAWLEGGEGLVSSKAKELENAKLCAGELVIIQASRSMPLRGPFLWPKPRTPGGQVGLLGLSLPTMGSPGLWPIFPTNLRQAVFNSILAACYFSWQEPTRRASFFTDFDSPRKYNTDWPSIYQLIGGRFFRPKKSSQILYYWKNTIKNNDARGKSPG